MQLMPIYQAKQLSSIREHMKTIYSRTTHEKSKSSYLTVDDNLNTVGQFYQYQYHILCS